MTTPTNLNEADTSALKLLDSIISDLDRASGMFSISANFSRKTGNNPQIADDNKNSCQSAKRLLNTVKERIHNHEQAVEQQQASVAKFHAAQLRADMSPVDRTL